MLPKIADSEITSNVRSRGRLLFEFVVLAALIALSAQVAAQALMDYERISLINLIATPERYDKKNVVVSGWLSLKLENMSLCIADQVPSSKECVWIELEQRTNRADFEKQLNKWKEHDGRLVTVHATFDKNNKGHLGGWSGALRRIVRITALPR